MAGCWAAEVLPGSVLDGFVQHPIWVLCDGGRGRPPRVFADAGGLGTHHVELESRAESCLPFSSTWETGPAPMVGGHDNGMVLALAIPQYGETKTPLS